MENYLLRNRNHKGYSISAEDVCRSKVGFTYQRRVDSSAYDLNHGKANIDGIERTLRNLKKMPKARRDKVRLAGTTYENLLNRAQKLYDGHKALAMDYEAKAQQRAADIAKRDADISDLAQKWQDNVEKHIANGIVDYETDAPVLAAFYNKAQKLDAKSLMRHIDSTIGNLRAFNEYAREENPAQYLAGKDWTPQAKVAALRVLKHHHTGDFGQMMRNLYRDQFEQVRAEVEATKDESLIRMFNDITHTDQPAMTLEEITGKEPVPVEVPAVEKKPGRISRFFDYVAKSPKRVASVAALCIALLSCGKGDSTPREVNPAKPETAVYVPENTKGTAWVSPYDKDPCTDEKKVVTPEVTKAPVVEKAPEDTTVKVEKPTPKVVPKEDKPVVKETPKEVVKPAPVVEKPADKPVVKTPDVPYTPSTAFTPSVPYSRRESDVQLKGILKGEAYIDDNMTRYAGNGKAIIDFGRTGIDLFANYFDQKQEFDTAEVLGNGGRVWGGLHHYLTLDKDLHLYLAAAGGFEKRDFTIEPNGIEFGNESPFLDVAVGLTGSRVDDEDFGVGSDHNFLLGRVTKHWGKATGDVESMGFGDEYEALRAQLKFQLMLDKNWSLNGGFSALDEKLGDFIEQRNWSAEFGPRFRFTIDESPAYVEALGMYRDLHSDIAGQESDDRGIGGKVGFGWRIINGDNVNVDLGVDVGGMDYRDAKDEWFVLPSVKVYLGGSRRKR